MDHLAEGFRRGALAPAAMPWRSAASRSLLEEELGANFAAAGRQHRGVLAEGFERTRVVLRGDDEGLLAHVGPDFQCGFNRNARLSLESLALCCSPRSRSRPPSRSQRPPRS